MKKTLVSVLIFFELWLVGCAPQPTPVLDSAGHVAYSMSATLDGKPLPALVGITASSCDDGYGGFTLAFTATADMEPQAIDDEIGLGLNIEIDDISKITIGKPIQVGNNNNIRLSASVRVFIEAPQDPVTTATGMITITALSDREMSGSASLIFTDPGDVNPTVKESLAYEVTFSNLAVIHYCPES